MKEDNKKKCRILIIFLSLLFIFIIITGCSASQEVHQTEVKKDQEFDQGSILEFSDISEQKIEDFAKLSKVWGLVKYYHPKVVSGDINWDYELFRVMPSILEENSDVNSILYEWVHTLGNETVPGDLEQLNRFSEDSIQLSPTTDWSKDKEYLGTDLSLELSKLLDSNISERKNAYVSFNGDSPFAIMHNESSYTSMKFDDTGYRLLGLFRYWNIIEYYFPYKDVIGEDWDRVLLEFIPKIIDGSDYDSYFMTLAELTSRIHDSHVYLTGKNRESITEYFGIYRLPVNFVEINNQIVISKVFNKCGLKVGDIVLKVGDNSIDELLEDRRKYISQSREDTAINFFKALFRTHQKNMDVTLIRQGKTMNISATSNLQEINFLVDTKSQAMENGEIFYINAGLLEEGEIDKIMKKWWNTKGLIVDLRNYPSSALDYKLAKYLIPSEKEFAKASLPNPAIPGEYYFEPLASEKPQDTDDEVYKGKVVILINEHTISNGEFTTMLLRKTENSIVLGRPTAGADGNVFGITLPGNIKTTISGIGIFYPEKKPTQRIGVQPDIRLDPTIEGIMEGRDEYVERAVELIKDGY
ncbi:C-terminal processing protease CtpA/Prc, contains a PDZ domain [Paenibacillus uliginis N3/975]|uniref:C-terminal processing protease CtpA/Prc, contains a PDZ domain n=1 Tax=Paenibacillus uliginis N3/975 TaxID=1313296 RepID=A0A1X7HUD0_9BACL|nr:S41 family peptidase [Paenibacillus uliginis]SMF92228.1 C-terminal processing protease CtpA/Prc, contains a PDZ domain [Paenibacillus uliginis N3/975]